MFFLLGIWPVDQRSLEVVENRDWHATFCASDHEFPIKGAFLRVWSNERGQFLYVSAAHLYAWAPVKQQKQTTEVRNGPVLVDHLGDAIEQRLEILRVGACIARDCQHEQRGVHNQSGSFDLHRLLHASSGWFVPNQPVLVRPRSKESDIVVIGTEDQQINVEIGEEDDVRRGGWWWVDQVHHH